MDLHLSISIRILQSLLGSKFRISAQHPKQVKVKVIKFYLGPEYLREIGDIIFCVVSKS